MPRTEAGKALVRDMLDPDEPLFPMDPGASIDAIEAEAVTSALDALAVEVDGLPGASPSGICVFRAAVLAAIDKARR